MRGTDATLHYIVQQLTLLGPDTSVGIVTHYRLDSPGSNPDGGRFSAPVQTGPRAHPAPFTVGTSSFLGVKWLGRGIDHPPLSSAKVKERVELNIYSSPLTI
jgi:hypothetical protein